MSLRINTNVTAMNALRNLQKTSDAVSTSIERLSSGLRINTAADDPAGLIISEGLRAQIDGLNQAVSNSQDASNLLKTGEGALTEVNSLLRSIRSLAVHAANTGVNDATAVQADQTQIQSALDSINRIASQTQFGTKHLLDGTAGVSAAVTNTSVVSGVSIGGSFAGYQTQAGNVTVLVTQQAARAAVQTSATFASLGNATVTTAGNIVINGQSISVAKGDSIQSVLDKINAMSGSTHVSASFSATSVHLTQQDYGSGNQISYAETASILNGGNTATVAGTSAVANVWVNVAKDGATVAYTGTFTGSTVAGGDGLRLSDSSGNSILMTEYGATTGAAASTVMATVSGNTLQFQIGSFASQYVSMSLGNVQANQLGTTAVSGKSLKDIDVTSAQGAADALKMVDEAIQQVSVLRAQVGAFQKNTLDSTIRSLGVSIENLSASESQIRDTDVASEVVQMTKNQILQQAGTSVLGKANSSPQQILSLLQ